VFTFATAQGKVADVLRTRLAPALFARVLSLESVREYLFRTVSQVMVNYRGSPLSAGGAGEVHGGDRLPWVAQDGRDNYTSLAAIIWQAHVYGEAPAALREASAALGLPLESFPWSAAHAAAGLERDALYLLRPDGYVALVDRAADPASLGRYFSARALRPQTLR
jgi:hypothetical protein